uniref:Uncharacterized protein n=1 Tax=Daphnia galeata TaxID=27404 RepID=A0A8J2S2M6_9CRUS|nr:unnamed protein product [Daphnia galeata]
MTEADKQASSKAWTIRHCPVHFSERSYKFVTELQNIHRLNSEPGQIVSGTDSITFSSTLDTLVLELSSIEFILGQIVSGTDSITFKSTLDTLITELYNFSTRPDTLSQKIHWSDCTWLVKSKFYIVDLHTPVGLQEATTKLNPKTATQKSDLSSEPEDLGRGKRVRRMTRPFSPGTDYRQESSSGSEEEGASQLMENGLPHAPFLLPVAQSTALSDESIPGTYSSPPNEENAGTPTQEICSQFLSTPITYPQSSSEVEDCSMQIHGQVPRKNSGASGSTYTENVVAGSSSPPACGSSGIMVVSDSRITTYGLFKIKNQAMFKNQ